ncbi:MAG: TfoX/Sxy family protein [Anaerolineales bacterium]|jgi:TfoX/Sxy family transcriptional regulator of competence genes
MVYDKDLAERVRRLVEKERGFAEKKMFGGIGYLVHGNMFCGVIRQDLIVRVGKERYLDALVQPHVELFDMTGRAMTGWVVVKEPGYQEDQKLLDWVHQGLGYARTLPPK